MQASSSVGVSVIPGWRDRFDLMKEEADPLCSCFHLNISQAHHQIPYSAYYWSHLTAKQWNILHTPQRRKACADWCVLRAGTWYSKILLIADLCFVIRNKICQWLVIKLIKCASVKGIFPTACRTMYEFIWQIKWGHMCIIHTQRSPIWVVLIMY